MSSNIINEENMKKTVDPTPATIEIQEVKQGTLDIFLVGTSPLLLNRMSEKAKRELLIPRGRLSAADKLTKLKHVPIDEFRAAAHRLPDGETLLAFPSSGFKAAMSTAAIDLPGTKKSQIGRWCYVDGEYTRIWGVPYLYMTTVRMADMNRTPDIRTLCIVPKWAARVRVNYVQSFLSVNAVANLVAAGGIYVGIGDGRPEKGKLSFGRYRVVEEDDAEFNQIVKEGGREVQLKAMQDATPYDGQSAEMLDYHESELKRRNFETSTKAKSVPKVKVQVKEQDEEEVAV